MASSRTAVSVEIIADTRKFRRGVKEAETGVEKFRRGVKRMALPAAAAGGAIIAFGLELEKAGEAAGTANARIENITKQMGYFQGRHEEVSNRLIKNAEEMAKKTGIDPNAIKQAQATLSTFGELAKTADEVGGAFDRTTQLAADLSASGFGSVESAATMLGKALGDPERGLTALRKVGVSFTADQEAMIKSMVAAGDTAGAQAEILKAVEQQVGGTAEATANASDKMQVKWQLLREELGTKLAPVFEKIREALSAFADFVGENSDLVLIFAGVIGTLSAAVLALNGAFTIWKAATAAQTAVQWALNSALLANPITWIVAAIVAAVALIVLNWEKIQPVVEQAWEAIKAGGQWVWDNILQPIVDFLASIFVPIWETLQAAGAAAWEGITAAAQWLWENILKPIGDFIGGYLAAQWEVYSTVGRVAWEAITNAAKWLWDNILKPIGDFIGGYLAAQWEVYSTVGRVAWEALQNAGRWVWDNLLKPVGDFVGGTLARVWETLKTAAVNAFNAMITPIKTLIGWLRDAWQWVQDVAGGIAGTVGGLFQFSGAEITQQSIVTAAPPALPALPAVPRLRPTSSSTVINISLPNYVGDKRELKQWLAEALDDISLNRSKVIAV